MKQKLILIIGILSMLFGCNNRESLGGNYYLNKDKNIIQYRYSVGGALKWYYKDLDFADNKTFKVFSNAYATDKNSIYFAGKQVKGVSSNGFQIIKEYPNMFAKNTLSKKILFKDSIIDLDYNSVKIHSSAYVSDKNKVVFIAKRGVGKYGQFHKVPVVEPSSFNEFKEKSKNGMSIGYDKHYIYLEGINTKIPSLQAQIIQLGLPTIILQNDLLHYLYPSHRKKETEFKELQLPLEVSSNGVIGSFLYDTYYHFSILGFKEASQISNSSWITDLNGLFFVNDSRIHHVSKKKYAEYIYDEQYPNYIKTTDSLIQVQSYPHKIIKYSSKAEILDREIVKDQDKIFFKGKEVENVDAETFAKLPRSRGFVDKNFYYGSINNKNPIPDWAYQEFLNGKNTYDLFGIDTKYKHTVYKTYWNGFLVSLSLPTKRYKSDTIQLKFKNIARKVIALKKPIEEQLYVSYQPYGIESPVYYQDKPKFTLTTKYDYKIIKNEEIISLSFPLNQQMVEQYKVIVNNSSVLPYLVLCSEKNVLERNDYDLYIKASNN